MRRPTHQGQSQRLNHTQSQSLKGNRSFGQSYDQESDLYEGSRAGSRAGMHSASYDDSYEAGRSPSYMDEYETNDRNRTPSRFSSLDDDRISMNGRDRWSSSEDHRYEGGFGRSQANQGRSFDRFDRGLDRQASSSEKFGYPRNMDSWSHSEADRGFFGKGPKGYKRSDDRIKEEVCETLARHPRIDASDIEVNVADACVTLSGTVDSKEIKRAAEMAIENLSGVDDVKNEIRIKRADSSLDSSSIAAKNSKTTSATSTSSKTHNS